MFSKFLLAAFTLSFPFISHGMQDDDRYQKALQFRDNKVQGYTQKEATDEAEKLFQMLALDGNPKAMHNFALIQYNKKKYDLAFEWFEKASLKGIVAAKNNMERMQKEGIIKATLPLEDQIGWNDMPTEIILKICRKLDDNSLLSLRTTEKRTAEIADYAFKKRSSIKTSLACLSLGESKHPYPYTVSYFIRKILEIGAFSPILFEKEKNLRLAVFFVKKSSTQEHH